MLKIMRQEDSMDDVKMAGMKRAVDLPKIEDKQHPVYYSEEKWQEMFFNTNPEMLLKLEMYKNMVIEKYEEESKKVDGFELL